MKYLYIFFLFLSRVISGQETIDIKFNEATPLWVHTMVDTTFVPVDGQDYYTKYSSLSPHTVFRSDNSIYTVGICLEKSTLDDYGFVMDKLDIHSGKRYWSHYNTPYVNGQKDIYHNFEVNGNYIEMIGAEEAIDKNFYSSYKKIDTQSGKLLKFKRAEKQLPGFYKRYFAGYILRSDSLFLNAYLEGEAIGTAENENYNYGLNTEVYNTEMQLKHSFRELFDFGTLGPFSIDQPNYSSRLNQSTIVSLAYKDRYDSWDNLGTKIMWTDISNPSKIETKFIKDYTDIIPGTKESFRLQRFNTIGNTILLSHYYPNFQIEQYACYILWLNSDGEIKTFIPIPKVGDHIYQFADMIYSNDDFAYLYVFPSIKNIYGFDIIRIENGNDTIKYISSLTSARDGESFVKNFNIHILFKDGYFIIGGYSTKNGQGTKTALKVYCFKASDLGINFEPVNTSDNNQNTNKFSIFPNPTSNTLYLKLDNQNQNCKLEIFNLSGKQVLNYDLQDNYNQIDISLIPKGLYFVNVSNIKGKKIGKTEKLVKIE